LVLGRISIWRFKKGKREDAFSELDRILNTSTRHTLGFRGYISMLSHDDANGATILTLWQDEESLRQSEKGVFTNAINRVKDSLESAPLTESFRVFSTELFQRSE
jgi:quinol monooxygenase YgiN